MKLYTTDDELAALEARERPGLRDLLNLAWQLRQRDSRRALQLAGDVECALQNADQRMAARIALLRAEIALLQGTTGTAADAAGEAEALLARAQAALTRLAEPIDQGDAALIEARLARGRGEAERANRALERAVALYSQGGDPERLQLARAWLGLRMAQSSPASARSWLEQHRLWGLAPEPAEGGALAALGHAAQATCLLETDPARAAVTFDLASEEARRCGLIEQAILNAMQAAAAFASAGDRESAIRSLEWAAAQARASGWAPICGTSLVRLGTLLREQGALERSLGVLQQALTHLSSQPDNADKATAQCELAEAELALGRALATVDSATLAAALARKAQVPALVARSLTLKVRALAWLHRPEPARQALAEAEDAAKDLPDAALTLRALRADLYRDAVLPPPAAGAAAAQVDELEALLAQAATLPGWQPDSALLVRFAKALADAGDSDSAFDQVTLALSTQAREAEKRHARAQALHEARRFMDQQREQARQQRSLQGVALEARVTLEQLHRAGRELAAAVSPAALTALLHSQGRTLLGSERLELVKPGTKIAYGVLQEPLQVADRALGTLVVANVTEPSERQRLILRTLGGYLTLALDKAALNERLSSASQQLEALSLTDAMTGLRNRRFLAESLESDVLLALRRYDAPEPAPQSESDLIFLLINLDHFRQVNDEYGHDAGDAVLMQLAERLRPLFREADHLVRWGGEEFLVVARGSGRQRAAELAERVRGAVASQPFELPDRSPLIKTCSIGFTCFPFAPLAPRAIGWQDVVAMAEIALYTAKRGGRNAWVGLQHGQTQLRPLLLQRAKSHLRHLIDSSELQAQSSLPMPQLKAVLI